MKIFGEADLHVNGDTGNRTSWSSAECEELSRAERENRPCCVMADGEQQPGCFHLQGRLDVGSDTDTLKELKCSSLSMLLNARAEPDFITTCVSSG